MKLLLTALLLLSTPVLAQESPQFCRTPAMLAIDMAKVKGSKELTTLHGVSIESGRSHLDELADVIIWSDSEGNYLAAAFINGCYWGYQLLNAEGVEALIEANTKRAKSL